jgi:multiple sugar transport system substrate-binding protein
LFQERYNFFLSELRNEILSGSLKPGEFILPENTLSEKYQMSRVSVRKALAELVEEGLIEKIAGKGNRVKPPENDGVRQTLTLTWFSDSYELDVLRAIIERFEESHPYVKVNLIFLPPESYAVQVTEMIEQGYGPDVLYVADTHFRQLEEMGKLDLLEPYEPPCFSLERDSYPKLAEMYKSGGKLLTVPILFSPVVICYNKDMFERAGISGDDPVRTWDDLLSVAAKCTTEPNSDGVIEQYGFCFSSSIHRWPVFVLQNDGTFKKDGRFAFSDKRNAEALQFCTDLMYKHQVSPIYSHSSSLLAEHLFKKEKCAMILCTYFYMNEFRSTGLRWDILPVPEQRRKATLLLGGSLGISKSSGKTKVAQSFIDFMTGLEAQTMLKRYGCTIPVLREVAENDDLLDPAIHPEHYNYFIDALEHSYSLRELGLREREVSLMINELHTLWANMDRPEDVCRRIEERVRAEYPAKAESAANN